MKKLLLILVAVILTASANAQSPEKMSYQAVVRNATNNLVKNQGVGMQISILQTSPSGTAVYVETHTPTTNANGLVTIEIGSGTVVSGSMNTIDWSAGPYFIQTETDPTGGTTYTITGTSQLMSQRAHYVGESYGGGIVFFVYDGGQHGLIASAADQSIAMRWSGGSSNTRARADGIGAGLKNTAIIIANQGPLDGAPFAATVCNEYSVTVGGVTYADWYLPSKHELNLMHINRLIIGGFASRSYWSSTEYDNLYAWLQIFNPNGQFNLGKTNPANVRAIRAF
jgi:hypothetical protein